VIDPNAEIVGLAALVRATPECLFGAESLGDAWGVRKLCSRLATYNCFGAGGTAIMPVPCCDEHAVLDEEKVAKFGARREELPTAGHVRRLEQLLRGEARSGIEVVSAPGDRCGNTGTLPDGSRCPGCRACA
jgi:hypothetical protein